MCAGNSEGINSAIQGKEKMSFSATKLLVHKNCFNFIPQWALKRQLSNHEHSRVDPDSMTGVLIRRDLDTDAYSTGNTMRRWPSSSQGERPQKKANLLTPRFWTSSLQNCKKIHLPCLSHYIYGIWLW